MLILYRYLVYSANEEGEEGNGEERGVGGEERQLNAGDLFEEDTRAKQPLRNQFNYSERAAQTVNNPYRVSLYFKSNMLTKIGTIN